MRFASGWFQSIRKTCEATLRGIRQVPVRRLNAEGVLTSSGKTWGLVQVKEVLERPEMHYLSGVQTGRASRGG